MSKSCLCLSVLICAFAVSGCAESLYKTSPNPLPDDSGYVFIGPYFADVKTEIGISISQPIPGKAGDPSTNKPATPDVPPAATLTVIPVPQSRSYLYLSRNGLFNNTVNVTVGTDGMLSSSDSSSAQQITAILTELGQTLGAAHNFLTVKAGDAAPPPRKLSDRKTCLDDLKTLVSDAPFYTRDPIELSDANLDPTDDTKYRFPVAHVKDAKGIDAVFWLWLEAPKLNRVTAPTGSEQNGVMAYYPLPAVASLVCSTDEQLPIMLSTSQTVFLYADRQYINPERDFFTSPQDTLTFNEGFLTGHKFTNQSGARTVVDTITAPIRAILPSVTVQQTVTTGGGKPDQTTTQTTSGPPKPP